MDKQRSRNQSLEHKGWKISSYTTHISPSDNIDALAKELGMSCVPEMLYLENKLEFSYNDFTLGFNARDAYQLCGTRDWTLETNYRGTMDTEGISECKHEINYTMLRRQDPILFFDSVDLYQDELHDLGESSVSVKTRVMDTCFLILLRFWLRIDAERVKLVDTRFFHEFGQDFVLRQTEVHGNTFEELGAKGESKDPAAYLDPNLVASRLDLQSTETHAIKLGL